MIKHIYEDMLSAKSEGGYQKLRSDYFNI